MRRSSEAMLARLSVAAVVGAAAFSALVASGCGHAPPSTITTNPMTDGGSTTTTPDDMAQAVETPDLSVPSMQFKFLFDSFSLPDPNGQKYFYDVDGNGTKENALAKLVQVLAASGGDPPQAAVIDALDKGTLLEMLLITSADPQLISDPRITVAGFAGTTPAGADPTMNFSGTATLDVDVADEPAAHTLIGALTSAQADTLHLPAASFPIHVPVGAGVAPPEMTLYAARCAFKANGVSVGDGGASTFTLSNGMLNGGLSSDDIQNKLIPAVATNLQWYVTTNPAGAAGVLNFFDTNGDGKISADEVAANQIVQNVLAPDIDLFDADGTFRPNTDHVPDSLSFGVGFTAVPVQFDPGTP